MRVRLGNPVTGEEFWPRPDVVDSLYRALAENEGSRRLFGLRRIGKTSVLLELQRRLVERPELQVIRIDVQALSRFRDFAAKVFEAISGEDRLKKVSNHLSRHPAAQAILSAAWTRFAGKEAPTPVPNFVNEFEHVAAWSGGIEDALRAAGPVVLIIDELQFMLRNMLTNSYKPRDVESFLATLRSWRMNAGVRMLLSGSLGLGQLKRRDRVEIADHIGDLYPESLPPLPRDEAIRMVDALAQGEKVADWRRELSEAVVDASAETWPIFLQYGFDAARKAGAFEAAAIKAVIDSRVRRALDETFYEQFNARLSRYEADLKPARAILKAVAAKDAASFEALEEMLSAMGAIESRDDLFEALREDDFLLFDTEAQMVRAASKLVPIWVRSRAWGR